MVVRNSVALAWPVDVLGGDMRDKLSSRPSVFEFADPDHLHRDPGNGTSMESATAQLGGRVHFGLADSDHYAVRHSSQLRGLF